MRARRRTGQGVDFLAQDAHDRPVYVISVAAELAGMHPQTLRQYDRLGLVVPARTAGRGRRYSHRDVERLRRIQDLSHEGINLEGIHRILSLERRLEELEGENRALRARQAAVARVFAAAADGEVQVVSGRGPRPARRERAETAPQGRPGTGLILRRGW
ncbi:MAG: MerR family transcriptional regulator [Actinomyces sp.]|uniref:heat shock protein transcriptional repressor HspR n=1 Tax=Actinomyces sp. TaxID=29317 RepID=UPI0026DB0DB3|nr:MerR family transcriptional regulator [Actinomyces sp.]MDO4244023.1 MerR family transcriptional regulator [Actinomyces sp.]